MSTVPGPLATTVAWKDIFDAATINDQVTVKYKIETEHFPLNQTNLDKQTLAHIFAKEGNLVMIKYVLQKEPTLISAKDKKDETILSTAIVNGNMNIIRYLVDDLKVDIYDPHIQRFGNNAVHIAAEEGKSEVLQYFIEEKKANVNTLNFLQEPPLFLAAEKPRMRIIKYLVEKVNAKVDLLDSNNDNILFISAMNGDLNVPKYLLDEKKINFDINWQDRFGRTLIYVASRFNQMNFLKYFIEEKGAKFDIPNNRGWTPIFEAAFVGNTGVIDYLVGKGANIHHVDKLNQTIEEVANDKVTVEHVKAMKEKRSRRSISESSVSSYQPADLPGRWMRMIATNSSGVTNRVHNLENEAAYVPSFQLQSFLVMANAVFKYANSFLYLRAKHEALLSPQEIVQSRIDPIAVEAINRPTVSRD